jgi:phosphoribosylformylglycinamidine synthase
LKLLESPTIADKSWIYRQYDHMVRTNTIVYPGSDAGVVRIKGTNKALAMSVDCNSLYCFLHPKAGGAIAVCESARNVVCSGGKPMALTDCLNFGNPEKPETMWQFKEAVEGVSLAAEKLGTPVVSGNVSFYNETKGMGIYPTPVIGMVGLLDDVTKATTQYFKDDGDVIILLGENKEEIGGTEYLRVVHGLQKGLPPDIDLDAEKALQDAVLEAIDARIVKSAHDCADGGLAVALAECCFKGEAEPAGCEIAVEGDIRKDALLFGESQSRIILSATPVDAKEIAEIMSRYNVPCITIGKVGGNRLVIKSGNEEAINQPVAKLKEVWRDAIPKMLRK